MESCQAAHPFEGDLDAIERGQVAAWTRYPPVPRWYYPGLGLAEGVFASFVPLGHIHALLALVAMIVAAALVSMIVTNYRRLRGQMPRRHLPRELRRPVLLAMLGFFVLYGGLLLIATTSWWPVNPLMGIAIGVLGGHGYERSYRRAADAAERRVGLQ